jgi:hypothetical protein
MPTLEEGINATLDNTPIDVPELTGVTVEFEEPSLSAKCFVRLFPYGKGSPEDSIPVVNGNKITHE